MIALMLNKGDKMKSIHPDELKVGKVVYYIASHLDKTLENSERGIISTIKGNYVWVRYTDGDTGAKTHIGDLYV